MDRHLWRLGCAGLAGLRHRKPSYPRRTEVAIVKSSLPCSLVYFWGLSWFRILLNTTQDTFYSRCLASDSSTHLRTCPVAIISPKMDIQRMDLYEELI